MPAMCSVIAVGLLALLGLTAFQVTTIGEAEPVTEPLGAECRPTHANGMTPPSEEASPLHHGDGLLYTNLWPDGEVLADPAFVEPDGSIGMKWPWWRAPGVGEAGDLVITGRELVTGAAIRSAIPDGYGQRFQASGILFPDEGCYEVTARSGDASLTFITKVTKVDGASRADPP